MTTSSSATSAAASSQNHLPALFAAAPCFGLPSSCLESTVVETLFRMGQISHVVFRNEDQIDSRLGTAAILQHSQHQSISGSASSALLPTPLVFDSSIFPPPPSSEKNKKSEEEKEKKNENVNEKEKKKQQEKEEAEKQQNQRRQPTQQQIEDSFWPNNRAIDFAIKISRLDETQLTDEEAAISVSVSSLVRTVLFPAIEFFMLSNDEDAAKLQAAWTKHNSTRRTRWSKFVTPDSAIREARLAQVKSSAKIRDATDAFAALERGFETLEKFIKKRSHFSSSAASGVIYFHVKHPQPSSVDAFCFAAISALLYGDFSSSSPLTAFQSQCFSEDSSSSSSSSSSSHQFGSFSTSLKLTNCKRYAQEIKKLFFEQKYQSSYFVEIKDFSKKSKHGSADDESSEDPYSEGRTQALAIMGVVVASFAVAANWKTLTTIFSNLKVKRES